MRPRLAALAVVVCVVSFGLATPVAAAQSEEGRLGIRLADGGNDARSRVYMVDHLAPGTSVERTVEVVNQADSELPVELYAGAAEVRDGRFAFSEGRDGNDLTAWTTIDPPTVTLAPGATSPVRVTIAVPPGTAAGERYGVVWAVLPPSGQAGGVRVVHRVGVRMYVSVGGGPAPLSDFVVDSLRPRRSRDGRPAIVASVRNTGGRALDLGGDLSLDDGPRGVSAGPFPVDDAATLGPGDTGNVVVTLPAELSAGPWRARLTLRSGTVARTVEAIVTFPTAGQAGHPVAASPVGPLGDRGVVGPLAGALAVLVAVAIAITAARRRAGADDDRGAKAPG